MSRRLAISFAVMFATLLFPQHARAGLADIIWEMSGPQMVGVTVRCRIPFNGTEKKCEIRLVSAADDPEKVWLAVEGGAYVSTGHNSGGHDYKFGRIGMFAFEPMLEFRYAGDISSAYEPPSDNPRGGAVYGGIGPMITGFVVKGAPPAFTTYGVKLRPIAMTYAGWTLEYNVRLFPNGVTADQFGFDSPVPTNRPFEAVHSIGVSIPWTTWRLWR